MRFRPCIDLRNGHVVQIVGSSLNDNDSGKTVTNFETEKSSVEYAKMYKSDNLTGGHIISLGPGNDTAVESALQAFPGGMQLGGGVTPDNADKYLKQGASHVIITSYVFREGRIDIERLKSVVNEIGKKRLVLDLSCRRRGDDYFVVTDRWQRFTDLKVDKQNLEKLSQFCDEFLVHGVDVEGKRTGIEEELVKILGDYSPVPVTYAGGANSLDELDLVKGLGKGRVDLTIGSALDIFGGDIAYSEVVDWQRREESIQ